MADTNTTTNTNNETATPEGFERVTPEPTPEPAAKPETAKPEPKAKGKAKAKTPRKPRRVQVMPEIEGVMREAMVESIKTRGVVVPVIKDKRTKATIEGLTRESIVNDLRDNGHDVPEVPVHWVETRNATEAKELALELNTKRRHMTKAQFEEHLVKLHELKFSQRAIAEALECHHSTISRKLEKLIAAGKTEPNDETVGTDGKPQSAGPRKGSGRKATTPEPEPTPEASNTPETPATPEPEPATPPQSVHADDETPVALLADIQTMAHDAAAAIKQAKAITKKADRNEALDIALANLELVIRSCSGQ